MTSGNFTHFYQPPSEMNFNILDTKLLFRIINSASWNMTHFLSRLLLGKEHRFAASSIATRKNFPWLIRNGTKPPPPPREAYELASSNLKTDSEKCCESFAAERFFCCNFRCQNQQQFCENDSAESEKQKCKTVESSAWRRWWYWAYWMYFMWKIQFFRRSNQAVVHYNVIEWVKKYSAKSVAHFNWNASSSREFMQRVRMKSAKFSLHLRLRVDIGVDSS